MNSKRNAARSGGRSNAQTASPLYARLLSDPFWTLRIIALLLVLLPAWAIYQKVEQELGVPSALYVYLAVGLFLGVVILAARLFSGEVKRASQNGDTKKDAEHLLKEGRRCLKNSGANLAPEARADFEQALGALSDAYEAGDWDRAGAQVKAVDEKLEQYFSAIRKSTTREYVESILVAVLIALVLRSFVIEAFKIPSGSMIPTLQVGDHIFVNKFIYGIRIPGTNIKFGMDIRKPKRGEVIVFKYPKDQDKDFIKRIVAVEGDTIEVKDEQLYINGKPVKRVHESGTPCEYEDFEEVTQRWEHRVCDAWQETLDGHQYTTIFNRDVHEMRTYPNQKITVPPGNVFVMGDNRDNSHDSRFWGFVPFELIKGKAMIIWWSSGEPEGIRVKRMGQVIQ